MSLIGRLSGLFGDTKTGQTPSPATQPNADQASEVDADYTVKTIISEAIAATDHWQKKLSDSPGWSALKGQPVAVQIAVMLAALNTPQLSTPQHRLGVRSGDEIEDEALRYTIVGQMLRRDLPLPADVLARLLSAWSQQRYALEYGLPGRAMLGAVERFAMRQPLDAELRKVLSKLRQRASQSEYGQGPNKIMREVIQRIDTLLKGADNTPRLPVGAFADRWQTWVATRPVDEQLHWQQLATHCASSAGKAQPSAKWQDAAAALIRELPAEALAARLMGLLSESVPDPTRTDDSIDIMKGMIWLTPQLDHGLLAGPVGRFAETCFRKVPNYGARSPGLGNATLWALSAMAEGPHAAAELFRLSDRVKYPSARRLIAKRLAELAVSSGQSLAALEDVGLPDHGLNAEGERVQNIGEVTATIRLAANETVLQWHDVGGRSLKSVPAVVRNQHKEALATVRKAADDIETARAGQVARLEASWVERREWALADWTTHYRDHPIRRPIVAALIWDVGGTAVLPVANQLETLNGSAFSPPPNTRVRLWHPLLVEPEIVLAWRERIEAAGITQPIRQAHREVYVLTDAERRTEVYSNRFAAHILRQHQFAALARTRGWQYQLMGQWDGWNVPLRPLPAHGVAAEYIVEAVDNGEASPTGIHMHVATDQLRFLDADRRPVALTAVDPLLLSEVMRDCDLFVAVASVANDPTWADGGPDGRFATYWQDWAFGDLGQSAAMRRALIARIVPRLSIASQLEIGERALIVTGKRHRYAIHFGSSNIQILPENRYLCIVPDGSPPEARNLLLPFAGDNLVSIILSKAFLLVDESQIVDRSILSQL